jgi:hypothetical protein
MLFLLTLLTASCSSPLSGACSCIQRPEPRYVADVRQALESMDALFAGRVVETTYRPDSVRVGTAQGDSSWFRSTTLVATFAVEERWKGTPPDTVQVETDEQTTACGARLLVHGRYLIEATLITGSVFATSKCGWTRPLAHAAELRALLHQTLRN